jgi:flagellar motor protein MotB
MSSLKNINFDEEDEILTKERTSSIWLVSLTDLISLILAFFIMLYSAKDISADKLKMINSSFSNYLGGMEYASNYQFKPLAKLQKKVNPTADLGYIETVIKNSLTDTENNTNIVSTPSSLIIEFNETYKNTDDLKDKITEKLLIFSRFLNRINNQIEIYNDIPNSKKNKIITGFISDKIEELGYEYKIVRILPKKSKKIIIENLDKTENKVRIIITIKSYETIF